jgi:hypothetical protein
LNALGIWAGTASLRTSPTEAADLVATSFTISIKESSSEGVAPETSSIDESFPSKSDVSSISKMKPSNTFDPFLLWRLYESQKKTPTINEYLPYWRVRDIRTFIDAKLDFPKINGFVPIKNQTVWDANFKQHNSSWDVLADVLRMQAILRAEEDLELI